jgi:hypothetical protein
MEAICSILNMLGRIIMTTVNENPPKDPSDREYLRKCNAIFNTLTGTNYCPADERDNKNKRRSK